MHLPRRHGRTNTRTLVSKRRYGIASQVKAGGIWAASIGSDSGYCIAASCITEWPNPATSTFVGGLTELGNATSTFSNGINLTDGRLSIKSVCIGTNLFTTLSVTGTNNVNPLYPDSLAGTPISYAIGNFPNGGIPAPDSATFNGYLTNANGLGGTLKSLRPPPIPFRASQRRVT